METAPHGQAQHRTFCRLWSRLYFNERDGVHRAVNALPDQRPAPPEGPARPRARSRAGGSAVCGAAYLPRVRSAKSRSRVWTVIQAILDEGEPIGPTGAGAAACDRLARAGRGHAGAAPSAGDRGQHRGELTPGECLPDTVAGPHAEREQAPAVGVPRAGWRPPAGIKHLWPAVEAGVALKGIRAEGEHRARGVPCTKGVLGANPGRLEEQLGRRAPTRFLWATGVAARDLHGREPRVASATMQESAHQHCARHD